MLKKLAVTAVIALAVAAGGPALADGMPRGSLKDAPVCCAAASWSGVYIGAGIGYGHLQGENNYWEDTGFSQSWKGEGAAGGLGSVVLGFDRQVREKYVVGLFVEYDWSNIELSYVDTLTPEQKFTLDRSVNVGARAGFLLTPTSLLYVTAGYSWAKGKNDGYFDIQPTVGPLLPGKSTIDLAGPFVGLGMETQLGRNLALRGEARYTMYGDEVVNSGVLLGDTYEDRFEANLLSARLVLTYKFSREEPLHPVPMK